MKIVVDAFGGDNAPQEIILGAVEATRRKSDLSVILAGNEEVIKSNLSSMEYDHNRIEILHASEVISNEESPTMAIRRKKDSSLVKALELLKTDDQIGGIVSAGSTGAFLTGAYLKLGRIAGISRPALAPILPSLLEGDRGTILIDCGANSECKPINLCHFALMGAAYAEVALGIKNPRVALLNNGAEAGKGTDLLKEVYPMLEKLDINFVGNIEPRYMFNNTADVIVADGFSGNIALKTCEGTAMSVMGLLKRNIKSGGLKAKIGALLLKDVFRGLKKTMDYSKAGGAAFLGVEKVVIKAHGSSEAGTIANAVLQADDLASKGIIASITDKLSNMVTEVENG